MQDVSASKYIAIFNRYAIYRDYRDIAIYRDISIFRLKPNPSDIEIVSKLISRYSIISWYRPSLVTSKQELFIVMSGDLHKTKNRHWTPFGNCQRPVFSLGVSQHMHKITNLWKFELNWSSKLQENNERKTTLVAQTCAFSMPNNIKGQAWYFTEATKAIASVPLVIALVPLKCSSRNLQFHHRVPFTKEKMPWCPCPFKNEAYRPERFMPNTFEWEINLFSKIMLLQREPFLTMYYSSSVGS